MITQRQIRAARNLVGWTQARLASAAGLSVTAFNNIERGNARPRGETLKRIEQELIQGGVEFTDGEGVRLANEVLTIQKYVGIEAIKIHCEDVMTHCPPGGDLVIFGLENARWAKYFDLCHAMMCWLEDNKVRERALLRHKDMTFMNRPNKYRWLSQDMFGIVDYTVYGNTISNLIWTTPEMLIITRSKVLADAYRNQFDYFWNAAEPVSQNDFAKANKNWGNLHKSSKNDAA